MRELRHVSRAAQDFSDYFAGQPNILPLGFPVEPTLTLCKALIQLPNGSTEGSVPILEAARDQLPALRRTYIPPEPEKGEEPVATDAPPVFRQGNLDVHINNLYIAIGTALDHYKSETGQDIEEPTVQDAPVEPRDEFAISEALASTIGAERAIFNFQEAFNVAPDVPKDDRKEELDRGLSDADSQLKVARSAASMPTPKPGLLIRIGGYIGRTPEALQTIGYFARASADAIEPIVKAGLEIIFQDTWLALLGSIKKAGSAIEESGRRMKIWRDGGHMTTDAAERDEDAAFPPPEFDLDLVHKMILRGQPPPPEWIPFIEELRFGSKPLLTDLTPLEGLYNLKGLFVSSTKIHDIKPISGLTNLESLLLASLRIKDIDPLRRLENLKIISLSGTNVSEISVLRNMEKLEELHLNGTGVIDLFPLIELENLRELYLNESEQYAGLEELIEHNNDVEIYHGKQGSRRGKRGGRRRRKQD